MIRPLALKVLALVVAQTLSANLLAAPAPTGNLSAALSTSSLALKSASTLDIRAASGNGQPTTTSTRFSGPSSATNGVSNATENQGTAEQLTLKLDTTLNKSPVSTYDTTARSGFVPVSGDLLTVFPENYSSSIKFPSTADYLSASSAEGLSSGAGATSLTSKDMMSNPGRTVSAKPGDLDAANNLIINELMRLLDQFSSDEFATGTLRAPIIVNLNAGVTDAESMLFLRPDVISNATVPEPGTLGLFALSLLALHAVRRRRV